MNQEKIGKFISECRKKKNLTQENLAEKLMISDRAVSKWERGLNMPDSSLMLDLCDILDISVNELLAGEIINKNNYMKKAEENLIELKKEKEESDKEILKIEYVIGYISSIAFLVLIFVASYLEMQLYVRLILIAIAIVLLIVGVSYCLRIEQKVGYYECKLCHHKYVPKYHSVYLAMHMGRTRYLKCPKCNKKSWNKKVITK